MWASFANLIAMKHFPGSSHIIDLLSLTHFLEPSKENYGFVDNIWFLKFPNSDAHFRKFTNKDSAAMSPKYYKKQRSNASSLVAPLIYEFTVRMLSKYWWWSYFQISWTFQAFFERLVYQIEIFFQIQLKYTTCCLRIPVHVIIITIDLFQ